VIAGLGLVRDDDELLHVTAALFEGLYARAEK
jgi:hypothetical protein